MLANDACAIYELCNIKRNEKKCECVHACVKHTSIAGSGGDITGVAVDLFDPRTSHRGILIFLSRSTMSYFKSYLAF